MLSRKNEEETLQERKIALHGERRALRAPSEPHDPRQGFGGNRNNSAAMTTGDKKTTTD
jgi:hypothetical protein